MIAEYLGFDSDYLIIALAAIVVVMIVLWIVNIIQIKKLKKNYKIFMKGKDAKSLEEVLIRRLDQVDSLILSNKQNEKDIQNIFAKKAIHTTVSILFQKVGLVKYDAFQEMGGKLSFSVALLNEKNDGFVLNAVHSREGCYTYIKEIVDGNSIIVLAEEEQEALKMAMESNK